MTVSCRCMTVSSDVSYLLIRLIICQHVSFVCLFVLCLYRGTADDGVLPLHDGFECIALHLCRDTVCVRVCVCVKEREREGERDEEGEQERERERVYVCVCVCVCVCVREREMAVSNGWLCTCAGILIV